MSAAVLRRQKTGGGDSRALLMKRVQAAANAQEEDSMNGSDDDVSSRPRPTYSPNDIPALGAVPVFFLFAALRTFSSHLNILGDCDEVFNYWEPTHYLMYQSGMQTWEYSPVYALRSYLYIWIHAIIGEAGKLMLGEDKILVFYFIKSFLALVCAACETFFYVQVRKSYGSTVAVCTMNFLALSPGMFVASTTFLPSSFAMYMVMLAFGFWFQGRLFSALFLGAIAAVVGWPFCAMVFVPIGLHAVARHGAFSAVQWSLFCAIVVGVPVALVDVYYYGRWTMSTVNIILYNVIHGGGSSELYGVEPASYYVKNLLLQFNVVVVLSQVAPLASLVRIVQCGGVADMREKPREKPTISTNGNAGRLKTAPNFGLAGTHSGRGYDVARLALTTPFYLWFCFMALVAHKEERFLYVVYPILCLAGAISLVDIADGMGQIWRKTFSQGDRKARKLVFISCMLVFGIISVARVAALKLHFYGSLETFGDLNARNAGVDLGSKQIRVCMGKEWYRFPSSYFLARGMHLAFLRSSFRGILPKAFSAKAMGTRVTPGHMNHKNKEEMTRYVSVDSCHYIIDLEFNRGDEDVSSDTKYSRRSGWTTVASHRFLDAERSPVLTRAIYIPFLSPRRNAYGQYRLLRNDDKCRSQGIDIWAPERSNEEE